MIKIGTMTEKKNLIGFNGNMLAPGPKFVLSGKIHYDLKMNDMSCICHCCCPMKMKGFIPV